MVKTIENGSHYFFLKMILFGHCFFRRVIKKIAKRGRPRRVWVKERNPTNSLASTPGCHSSCNGTRSSWGWEQRLLSCKMQPNYRTCAYLFDLKGVCARPIIRGRIRVRVPRRSQVKKLAFFETTLPLCPLSPVF
jgi:hypothetical protein